MRAYYGSPKTEILHLIVDQLYVDPKGERIYILQLTISISVSRFLKMRVIFFFLVQTKYVFVLNMLNRINNMFPNFLVRQLYNGFNPNGKMKFCFL